MFDISSITLYPIVLYAKNGKTACYIYDVAKLRSTDYDIMLQRLYRWTPYVPKLFGFSYWFSSQFSNSKFLELIQFWKEHDGKFEFTSDGRAILKELNFSYKISDALNFNDFFRVPDSYPIYCKNGQIYMDIRGFTFLLNFPHGIFELLEVFHDNCYGLFEVKNKTVVDVGAFIADSAIYFAGKGAEKVVAFEPNPHIFEIAKENVCLNNFVDKVHVRQEAVAKEFGVRDFMFCNSHPGGSSIHFRQEDAVKFQVSTVPLLSITEELGHVDLLKLDCEGAEYEILLNGLADGALEHVDKIMMEVHGPVEPIEDILCRAEFEVTKKQGMYPGSSLHLLFAEK